MFKVPNKFRIRNGFMQSTDAAGNNGAFVVRSLKLKHALHVIASDQEGWEHVSVSRPDRCPSWEEMSFIKDLFWDDEDFVVQMHPPKVDYVNYHPYCLHLWRKTGTNDFCERPPSSFVGNIKEKYEQDKRFKEQG
jgi:hypothetical protein